MIISLKKTRNNILIRTYLKHNKLSFENKFLYYPIVFYFVRLWHFAEMQLSCYIIPFLIRSFIVYTHNTAVAVVLDLG